MYPKQTGALSDYVWTSEGNRPVVDLLNSMLRTSSTLTGGKRRGVHERLRENANLKVHDAEVQPLTDNVNTTARPNCAVMHEGYWRAHGRLRPGELYLRLWSLQRQLSM